MSKPFVISLAGGMDPIGKVVIDENGVPHKFYRKDLVRAGEFIKASSGQTFVVDRKRLERWSMSTAEYMKNGNECVVCNGHDHTGDPDKSRGYLRETWVEGDTLYGKIELIGEDAIQAASRSHVSIYSPPEWIDGEGKKYEWPIRHVAMTTDPVITKQGRFLPIAASHGSDNAELLTPMSKGHSMNKFLEALKKKLGIETELDEENGVEVILSHFEAARKTVDDETGKKVSSLEKQVTDLKAKLAEGSENTPHEMSHNERGMAKRLVKSEIEARVNGGNITPAVAKKLEQALTSSDVMLSFNDDQEPTALAILEALKENDPVKLGERTKRQRVELSHKDKPPVDESDNDEDTELSQVDKDARDWAKKQYKKANA